MVDAIIYSPLWPAFFGIYGLGAFAYAAIRGFLDNGHWQEPIVTLALFGGWCITNFFNEHPERVLYYTRLDVLTILLFSFLWFYARSNYLVLLVALHLCMIGVHKINPEGATYMIALNVLFFGAVSTCYWQMARE